MKSLPMTAIHIFPKVISTRWYFGEYVNFFIVKDSILKIFLTTGGNLYATRNSEMV